MPAPDDLVSANVRLVRPLGEGGMGAVWLADHLALHTQVVVKFMSTEMAASAEGKARFSREAAAASQVKSPHVVQMLDYGVTEDGTPYIVMEHLEGHDLEAHLERHKPLEPAHAAEIVTQLCRALGRAHERGIVHRDIKPANVFLVDVGGGELFVKLLDFGIAKGAGGGLAGSTTRTGSVVGSPFYMSPEQVIGDKNADFRSDLWSLGVVAFEALTGQRPFVAETLGALALRIHNEPLPLPSQLAPHLPPSVDAWFARACARDPAHRFASAKELAEGLSAAVTGAVRPPALSLPATSGPAAAVAGGAGALALARTESLGATAPDGATSSSPTLGGHVAASRPRGARWAVVGAGLGIVVLVIGLSALTLRGRVAPAPALVAPAVSVASSAPSSAAVPEIERLVDPAERPVVVAVPTSPASRKPARAAGAASVHATPPRHTPGTSDDDIK